MFVDLKALCGNQMEWTSFTVILFQEFWCLYLFFSFPILIACNSIGTVSKGSATGIHSPTEG